MKAAYLFFVVNLFSLACFAQAPESPAMQKRKVDSLFTLLKNIPEHSSPQNDTIRLNAVLGIVKRTEEDTFRYYLGYAFRKCAAYSKLVANAETSDPAAIREALKKDAYLDYYLKVKARILRIYGNAEPADEAKLNYYLRSLKICEKTGDKPGQAVSYTFICYVYNKQAVYSKAIENLLLAQNIYRETRKPDQLADNYCTLGEIYHKQLKFDEALENYKAALKISKTTGNPSAPAIYYELIGNCYTDMGNYPKAIENHFASLKISGQLNDIKGVGDSYGDIATIYYKMKDYRNYLVNATAALEQYKVFADPVLIANAYSDIANANTKLGRTNEALHYLDSAIVIYKKENDSYNTALSWFSMGEVYAARRDYAKAAAYMEKVIKTGREHNYNETLKDAYKAFAGIYVSQNDYKTAYRYQGLFMEIKDSLARFGDETVESIQAIQSKFDKEKSEQEKLLHEAIVAQKEAQISQERTQRYALYGGLLVLLLFGAFTYNRYKISQKQQRIIEKQKQVVEEKNKEIRDSIHYAKRIQTSLLPTERYIERVLKEKGKL